MIPVMEGTGGTVGTHSRQTQVGQPRLMGAIRPVALGDPTMESRSRSWQEIKLF